MLRILLLALFVLSISDGAGAKPRPNPAPQQEQNASGSRASTHRRLLLLKPESVCDDTALKKDEVPWRALMVHAIAPGYSVGLTSQKAWRPLENFGDRDAKVRVYNPTVGVAFRYSF